MTVTVPGLPEPFVVNLVRADVKPAGLAALGDRLKALVKAGKLTPKRQPNSTA